MKQRTKSRDTNTRLLRAEALAGAEEDDPLLSCSVLLASSPDLPQIPRCSHVDPPRSFPFLIRRLSFHSHPPFAPSSLSSSEVARYLSFKIQPRNRSLNASTFNEVWLDGTRPWLFWFTLSFPDCSRLFLYLAVVVCISMVLLSVAAGARSGSVPVVCGLGRRRETNSPEASREKCVLNQHGPERPPPRTRLSMHRD